MINQAISPSERLLAEVDGPIGWIIFNNVEKRNALTLDMYEALPVIIDHYENDPSIRVIVLKGAGEKAFVAGGDLARYAAAGGPPKSGSETQILHDNAHGRLRHAKKPTIAMIHGYAIGGGFIVALDCDMRISDETGRFGLPQARLGRAATLEVMNRLIGLIGWAKAGEMLYTGRHFTADECLRMGYLNQVVPSGELDTYVRNYCTMIAENAPLSIAAGKGVIEEIIKPYGDVDRARCEALVDKALNSQDYIEGPIAFKEKRKPVFTGKVVQAPEPPVWDFRPASLDWSSRKLGTVVPNFDLGRLSDADFERVGIALLTHSAIALKGQSFDPQAQVEFTKRFGPIFMTMHREKTLEGVDPILVLSNVVKDGKPAGLVQDQTGWHTDGSAFEIPFGITVLHAVEVPPVGGQTKYADMYAAYDAVPEEKKRRFLDMRVLHRQIYRYGQKKEAHDLPDVIHPLVRTHPQTGRRALYTGEKESACALGMPEDEGLQFMRDLIDFATQPQFVYVHQWEAGDVVAWDNRALLHSVMPYDMKNHRRLMHRTGTHGERPFLVPAYPSFPVVPSSRVQAVAPSSFFQRP